MNELQRFKFTYVCQLIFLQILPMLLNQPCVSFRCQWSTCLVALKNWYTGSLALADFSSVVFTCTHFSPSSPNIQLMWFSLNKWRNSLTHSFLFRNDQRAASLAHADFLPNLTKRRSFKFKIATCFKINEKKQIETGNIGVTDSLCSMLEILCLFGYRGWTKMCTDIFKCGGNILDQSASSVHFAPSKAP